MNVKEATDAATPAIDRINDAIRENPLAAGLIGAGIAWMLFGTKGATAIGDIVKGTGKKVGSAVATAGSATVAAGQAAVDAGANASSAVRSAASRVADKAVSIVPDMPAPDTEEAAKTASDLRDTTSESFQNVVTSGREYGAAIQSRLSETFEKQPLALGALGLVIGAGIASTFATTAAEKEWMGKKGRAARETVQGAISDAKELGQKVVSDVQEEAQRQGITPGAAKDAALSVARKVGNVVDAARATISNPSK